jgi:hypothetical protein
MKTRHMKLRMSQRRIDNAMLGVIEKFGEFNVRGDRIVLSRKLIMQLLSQHHCRFIGNHYDA